MGENRIGMDQRMLALGYTAPAPNGRLAGAALLADAIAVLEQLESQDGIQEFYEGAPK
jgi:hypothetical protein